MFISIKNFGNNLFSEKNISKLILLTPVFTVLISSFFTIYFFIENQNKYYKDEVNRIEIEYINNQKAILQREIKNVINYIDFHKNDPKKDIIEYIESIRFGKHGYIWIHDTNYYLVAHPFRKDRIGTYDINLADAKGQLITKRFIDETLKNPNGIFMEYYWQKPEQKKFSKKLGFLKLYEPFNWVIGTGLYIDDIEKSILESKKILEDRIDKYIQTVITISIFVILLVTVLSYLISKKINKVFDDYKDNVKRKELELQNMNKNLENRIEIVLNEAKRKDRAMLHQSRLARMGAMLSMIAHQWRQPLSEISAILMELETANKFGKLNNNILKESIYESNNLINFMSNTIDDFRNFFRPDKKKIEFYIDDACSEAITLAGASIKSLHINLSKNVKCNSVVFGYEREFAQVMLNLISNAKDILSQRNILNPKIDIEIDFIDSKSIILVKDNAGGINEEHLELIFEPYFTTKESSKGTGLGLYMSKMIIETNMNGELSVENGLEGAIFKIVLG